MEKLNSNVKEKVLDVQMGAQLILLGAHLAMPVYSIKKKIFTTMCLNAAVATVLAAPEMKELVKDTFGKYKKHHVKNFKEDSMEEDYMEEISEDDFMEEIPEDDYMEEA